MIVHGFAGNDLYPARFGASQRLLGLYRGLARGHETHVLAQVPNRHPGPVSLEVSGIRVRRARAWYTAIAWRLERARLAPDAIVALAHDLAAGALRASLPGTPDVVIADLALAGVLSEARGALRVYHAHNVELDHFRTAGPRVLGRGFWAQVVRSIEARACAAADLVTVTGASDAERMHEEYGVPPARLLVIPNGYDETAVRPPSVEERSAARAAFGFESDETVALFLGSDVPHNRSALTELLARGLPDAGTRVRVLVVGGVSRALAASHDARIVSRPETDDLRTALHAADVGLNPALSGSGSNVKLPTYLAAGLAVVTTPHGVRGYETLMDAVEIVPLEKFGVRLAAAPRGWHARGAAPPTALARHAWGALGEHWGERLGERVRARLGAAATPPTADAPREVRA
ncbi:MAG: glycosyltransferase [Candidatus Eisenbacteria bacterium]|uniref:Glycosyltransferase n=1 Tax=Eiseniibacteriota bacterium TaxID=2212470 RepID=A0A849SDI3_UNCEI|nr:glycosyltransferase [Candidatus Eisenbacteria bacterium]